MRPLLEATLPARSRYGFVGVPYDAATTLGLPGARYAPPALREAIRGAFARRLSDGRLADIELGVIDLRAVEVADYGDAEFTYDNPAACVEQAYAAVSRVCADGAFPLVCGGDHGVTYPAFRAVADAAAGRVGLIQLDAHHDLMDSSPRQGRVSGSSGIRRCVELEKLDPHNAVVVGVRGYTTVEQYEAVQELGLVRITAEQFDQIGPVAAARQALSAATRNTDGVYLTIDLDVFTPGEAPGTGWPEPGGLTATQVIVFVRELAPVLVGVDIAELNPLLDSRAAATTTLAARLMLSIITTRARQEA